MGEPGTKEVLRLEDLEAAGNIHTGRKHVLSVLVENKADVNIQDDFGHTPLHLATERININMVKLLLETGVSSYDRNWF